MFGGGYNETFAAAAATPPFIGALLHVWDTAEGSAAGWRRLAECPGTPRSNPAFVPVDGKLYLIGGSVGADVGWEGAHVEGINVVDNWVYDPDTDSWETLPDLPISNSNFKTNGAFDDRYILLVGGGQYFNATRYGPRHFMAAYGRSQMIPDGHCGIKKTPLNPVCNYWGYQSDVLVFDARLRRWGTITYSSTSDAQLAPPGCGPFPLNVNRPQVSIVPGGDTVAVLGGEADQRTLHGVDYIHDSQFAVLGKITVPAHKSDDKDASAQPFRLAEQVLYVQQPAPGVAAAAATGSEAKPFASIHEARDHIRALRRRAPGLKGRP